MCLPVCPTYQVSKNENESPRGRIALMQGIVNAELALSKKVTRHLDHCVSCLSCEDICPSTVQYETLIDGIREYTVAEQGREQIGTTISSLLKPSVKHTLFALMRFYQSSYLQMFLRRFGVLKLLGLKDKDRLLPKLSSRLNLKPLYLSQQEPAIGTVALFTGCLGNLFEQQAIQASIRVLNTLGYHVEIPEQVCCGALHQHSGFPKQAEHYAKQNRVAFIHNTTYSAILFTASGCGTQLKTSLAQSTIPVNSVMQFIYKHAQQNALNFKANTQHIAVHQPCSLKNSLHEEDAVIELLAQIPKLNITLLETQCCGAAGKNILTQPQLAEQIRQPLLEQIYRFSPNLIVSSNIGCALHLRAGLSNNLPLKHPIEVIDESLG